MLKKVCVPSDTNRTLGVKLVRHVYSAQEFLFYSQEVGKISTNVTTLMARIKMVTYAKISPKMVNPRDTELGNAGEEEDEGGKKNKKKKKKKFCTRTPIHSTLVKHCLQVRCVVIKTVSTKNI